jgi:hypothetical protein
MRGRIGGLLFGLLVAAGDGRLSLEELGERLDAVYAAKTYADLEPITRDLPDTATASPPSPHGRGSAYGFGGEPTSRTGIGIMGGFDHSSVGPGRPGAPRVVIKGFAFWGGVGAERKATDTELQRRKAERKRLELERKRDRR